MKKKSVFLLEDDPAIQRLIQQILVKEGYRAHVNKTLESARRTIRQCRPDLIILDRRLPDGDGLEFCRDLKNLLPAPLPPVLFLTSKNSTTDKVLGIKMGGDDYLTKPFQVDELLARIEALLRRSGSQDAAPPPVLSHAGIELDSEKHSCIADGREKGLWPKEFELLRLFLSKPGKVISKEFISREIWGHDFIDTSRAIEMTVRRLKNKLGSKGALLVTVKGYGFKLEAETKRHARK
ncbi:MAG: response regulator transcription factor [Elusimicrobia bacterium]|nr:response regulator transcription factor [Elusimicrobiota bacterium]